MCPGEGRKLNHSSYYFLFLCLLGCFCAAAASNEDYPKDRVKPGDVCAVSGQTLNPQEPDDVVLIVNGRRIPLKGHCVKDFLLDQERYFRKLSPKAALFTEEMDQPKELSLVWFYFGLYVLLGFVFAAITSQAAVQKGFPPAPWFFAGLLANILGYLAIRSRKPGVVPDFPKGVHKVHLTADPILCPDCGNENHPAARKCLECRHPLSPTSESEVTRA